MSRLHSSRVSSCSALFAALAFAGLPVYGQTPYLGVNFEGGGGFGAATPVTLPGGLLVQGNWNNVGGTSTTDLVLNDASGTATPVTLSFTANEVWGTGTGTTTGSHQMFNGYIGAVTDQTITLTLNNLPTGVYYDLVVYTMRDSRGTSGYTTSANPTFYHIEVQDETDFLANPTFVRGTSTDAALRQRANYVAWNALAPTGGSLSFSAISETARAPINGFQLTQVKVWSGATSGVWDTTTANWSGLTFAQNDSVYFGDTAFDGTAATNRNITQSGTINVGALTVDNSAGDYVFNGPLTVGAGGLTKRGTGKMTLSGGGASTGLAVLIEGGTIALDKPAETFLSLNGTGAVESASATTLTIGTDNTFANFTGVLREAGGPLSLVKAGSGRQILAGANSYTGTTTVNGGTLELRGAGRIFNAGAITVNGTGTRTVYPHLAGQPQLRQGALTFSNLDVGNDPLGTTPVILNGAELVYDGTGATQPGPALIVQNLTAARGMNTLGNQAYFGAAPLVVQNLTRSVGATIDFRSYFGTLGIGGDNGQVNIENLNGAPIANDAGGILGGWAIVYNGDGAPWDSYWATYGANGVTRLPDASYVPTVTGAAATANVRVTGAAPDFVTANATINSLVVRENNSLTIDAGATVTVNSGGILITYGSENQIGGAGNLTTGLASGELFVHSYDAPFNLDRGAIQRFNINANIVDNGATPTILVKSGFGPMRLGGLNTYTGGTRVNFGILQIRNAGALGSGAVTVEPGAQLQFGPSGLDVANNVTLNGPNAWLVGGLDAGGVFNTFSGTLTLNGAGNVTTEWADKELTMTGQITGNGSLNIVPYQAANAGPRITISNTTNNYTGDTNILAGTHAERPLLRAGAANVIPGGPGRGNVRVDGTLELNGFDQTINGLSGTGTVSAGPFVGIPIFTVGANNATSTFTGNIFSSTGNELDVVKTGTGTFTVGGTVDNTSARAAVNQGTLVLAKTSSATVHAFSAITGVQAGAVVRLAGTGGDQLFDGLGFGVNAMEGTFDMNGRSEGFDTLSGSGLVTNSAASTVSTLTLGTGGGAGVFSGSIENGAGQIALTKVNTGQQTLSGVNTYTGNTIIQAGTLVLTNAASTNNIAGSPLITVATGATLDVTGLSGGTLALGSRTLNGGGTVLGNLSTTAGAVLSPGSPTTIGTLTVGNLSIGNGTTLDFLLGAPGTVPAPGQGSRFAVQGDLSLGTGLVFNPINNAGANGQGSLSNGVYSLFSYTGMLTGFTGSNFVVPSMGSYAFSNANNQIYVTVSGLLTLTWTGAVNGAWDTATSNWAEGTTASTFTNGANVLFGDTNPIPPGGAIANSDIVIQAGGVQPGVVTFNNSAVNYTLTGADAVGIAGPSEITKTGTGSLTLLGANTFTGAVTVSGGILNVTNAAALGTSAGVTVASGAALQLDGGIVVAGAIPLNLSGAGVTASPAGALRNVSGANTFAGAITLAAPTTIGSSAGALTLSGAIENANHALTFSGAGDVIVSGAISGGGSVTKTGTGLLNLTAANTFAGGTNVNAGILRIGNARSLGADGSLTTILAGAGIDLNGQTLTGRGYRANIAGPGPQPNVGTIFSTGGDNINASFDSVALSADATIGSDGGRFDFGRGSVLFNEGNGYILTKQGTNSTYILNQSVGFAGFVVNGGRLLAENDQAFGTNLAAEPTPVTVNAGAISGAWGGRTLSNPFTLNGGTLLQDGGFNDNYLGPIAIGAGGGTFNAPGGSMNFLAPISGSGPLTKTGGGLVTLPIDNRATFSGPVTVNAGRLQTQAEGALGTGAVTVNGGTLDLSGFNQSLPSLAGAGRVELGGATLTVGSNNASTSFNGAINGGGSFVKEGTGVMSLGGFNTYSGTTTINGGTLKLEGGAPQSLATWTADSLTGANGAAVTQWLDSVGNVAANTFNTAPTLGVGTLGGRNVVQFSPTQALEIAGGANPIRNLANYAIAFVFRANVNGVGGAGSWWQNTGVVDAEQPGGTNDWGLVINDAGQIGGGNGSDNGDRTVYSSGGLADGNGHVVIFSVSPTELTLNVDGAVTTLARDVGLGARNASRILFGSLNGGNFFTGELAQVRMFGDALSAAGTQALGFQLATTYGLNNPFLALGDSIPDFSAVTLNNSGSTLDVNGFTETIGSLAGAAGTTVALGTGRLITGSDGTNTTFDGVISGAGGVNKIGTGTQTLSGANTFAGTTNVEAGTLLVTGSLAGAVNVSAAGTLGGTGTIAGSTTIAGGTLAPGTSAGTLVTNGLSLDAASSVRFELTLGNTTPGGGINDLVLVNGPFTLDGTLYVTGLGGPIGNGTYVLFDYSGALTDNGLLIDPAFLATNPGSEIQIDTVNTRVLLAAVPEPGVGVSLLSGFAALLGCRRRRRA